jgi:uncharacterized protein YggU (UPF0235/DUF167 family)
VNDGTGRAWRATAGGVLLDVRLTPKGGRDAIEGIAALADGRTVVKARVRAAPENDKANAALVTLVARALAVAPSEVALVAGARARIKRLAIAGDGPVLIATLERIAGAGS